MNNNEKRGRGRPKGATSTIEISVADLLAKIGDNPNSVVHVGRTWFSKYGSIPETLVRSSQDGDFIPEEILKQLEKPIEFTITR